MPANIYRLKDGTVVPGVTTLVKLADDMNGLIGAAAKIGPTYREVWDRETAIGTEVHEMIVQHLNKQTVTCSTADPDIHRGAWLALQAAGTWLMASEVEPIEWEVSL